MIIRHRILACIQSDETVDASTIALRLGDVGCHVISSELCRMAAAGHLVRVSRGRYRSSSPAPKASGACSY